MATQEREAKPAIGGLNGANALNGGEVELLKQLPLTVSLEDERAKRVDVVGGKAASLAELNSLSDVNVPEAFVITTFVCNQLLEQNPEIRGKILDLDQCSVQWLRAKLTKNETEADVYKMQVREKAALLEEAFGNINLPSETKREILRSYNQLGEEVGEKDVAVAVRSSCTLEDRADFSFAGQYKTELHQVGEEDVLKSTIVCLASQFGTKVIEYRNDARLGISEQVLANNGGDIDSALGESEALSHGESKLAVVVQRMVNASNSVAGVAFSRNSNTGADKNRINVAYGLGEKIVSGGVTPDFFEVDPREFEITGRKRGEKATKTVYADKGVKIVEVPENERRRFCRTDAQIVEIARALKSITKHYGKPMDTEFAFDNKDRLYFTQARPDAALLRKFPEKGERIVEIRELVVPEKAAEEARIVLQAGTTGCPGVATGEILVAENVGQAQAFLDAKGNKGKRVILVTEMTDPDWAPVMGEFAGIVTRIGGENCHAAIVGREKGIPTLIGVGSEIERLHSGEKVTLDVSAHRVYDGVLPTEEVGDDADVREIKKDTTGTVIKINMSMPEEAGKLHAFAELGDNFGISLLRIEFILTEIGVHVNALVDFDNGNIDPTSELYGRIADKIAGFASGKDYYITMLSEEIASIASNFPNSDVVVRTTDFKTNEYANLIGGKEYEKVERNPTIGNRGLGRAIAPQNREATKWELEAIKKARDKGNKNIVMMFPMVRDPGELTGSSLVHSKEGHKGIFEIMEEVGLKKGEDGLKVGMMVEVPANVILIEEYLDTGIDFISFGSNDLTQLVLGVDRDSEELAQIPWYNEKNPAVMKAIVRVIEACKKRGVETGICGNAPSKHPEIVRMLVNAGINSIGVTKDRYMATRRLVVEEEKKLKLRQAAAIHTSAARLMDDN